ncbi:hypothetical protein EMIHUDRAFT_109813 [Emiliania huxleyi CCMP1516]|uniref:Uncharacterized protein n=2 Tax=Emiliania huxleyi TaxID=2903 RepID=A0A0D3KNM0_EMIH1|nr:hypothetical protein EMIHUDRAFT_109813 [Emiliania huxleyi CCMP1516]EOD37355.1 hypothetical protein EMIHUDRAFT_109813 [Emiliania huxleyi CCMP1516]|eukprot:XP_005789784.1 hypothetical protein EMIHUDRAFT_109813 [Emiliania huxleyi CCMP1516]
MPDVAYGTPVADTGPVPLGTPVYPPPPVSPAAAAPAVNQHAFGGRDDYSRPLPMRVGGCGVKRHIGGRVLLPDWLHVSGCCSLCPPYFCCSSLTLLVSPDRPASAAPPARVLLLDLGQPHGAPSSLGLL